MTGPRPESGIFRGLRPVFAGVLLALLTVACTPTVQMAAPKEPITVNLNVKIQHEIYVKVDKEVEEMFSEGGLF